MGKKLLSILAFLCLTVSSAWAQWGGETYIATADEELGAIEVTADATLTINTGVKVTVNGGIDIKDGATLTVMGSGTLVVYGTTAATKWKTFGAFWHRNNMRGDYNDALEQRKTLEFLDKLKTLFADF